MTTTPDQPQDLTPAMLEMRAQLAQLHSELSSLKARAQALPLTTQPSRTSTFVTGNPTSTRRSALRRLAGGMLIGLAAGGAAFATGGGESLAKTSVNPASASNKVGTFIVPPGQPLPTGIPGGSILFGLIATDGNSLNVFNFPGNLNFSTGVLGYSVNGNAVSGYTSGSGGFGVYGYSNSSTGYGVVGHTSGTNSYSVYSIAEGTGSYAGYFLGDVHLSGTLTGGTKSFKIDHPLDPANKYLYHTSVESPDMKNIYDGVVTLDNQGEAIVEMPVWFEALNSDYRYQLTSIGISMPDLFIAEKLANRKFKIAGGKPGREVSWMVTGIRQDAYAKAHRSPVEVDKTGDEKGKYMHPELFGQPEEKSVSPRPQRAGKK